MVLCWAELVKYGGWKYPFPTISTTDGNQTKHQDNSSGYYREIGSQLSTLENES